MVAAGVLAGPVKAQTSVTLYGIIDSYVAVTHAGGKGTAVSLDGGGYSANRFGLRGVEDIGGGLAVNFQLENGFLSNNGALADQSRLFSRQAWVGMSGSFGEVRAGRQNSPQFVMLAQLDAFYGATFASMLNNASGYTPRYDNVISYTSPSMAGIKVQGMFAPGGQADPHTGNNVYSVALEYAKGPVYAGINHVEQRSQNASFTIKSTFAGGNIDYGYGKIYAGFYRGNNNGSNAASNTEGRYFNVWSLSADWRIDPATTVAIGGGFTDSDGGGGPQAYEVGAAATYSLSKTTFLYSSIARLQNRRGGTFSLAGAGPITRNVPTPGGTETGVQVGIRHAF